MFKKKFITLITVLSIAAAMAPAVTADENDDAVEPAPLIDVTAGEEIGTDGTEMHAPPVIDYSNSTYMNDSGEPLPLPSKTSDSEPLKEDEKIPVTNTNTPPAPENGTNADAASNVIQNPAPDTVPNAPYTSAPDAAVQNPAPDTTNTAPSSPADSTNPELPPPEMYASPASGGTSGPMGMAFEDVKQGSWYYDVVAKAYMMGLISGMSDTVFAPDSAVTGAQLVTMLYRAAGNEVSEQTTANWYDEPVSWASQNSIISSEIGWEFDPDADLSREQMMVILYNYMTFKNKTNSASADLMVFADGGEVSEYAKTAVSWLVEMQYIVGDGTTLRPKDNLSRAETAVILVTAVENQSEYLPTHPDPNAVGRPEDNLSLYPDGAPSENPDDYNKAPAPLPATDNNEDFDPTPDNISTFPGTADSAASTQETPENEEAPAQQ